MQLEWYLDRPVEAIKHLKGARLVLIISHGQDHPLVSVLVVVQIKIQE